MTRLLLVVAAVVALVACAGTATGATWVVDDDGGADFTTIQAVAAASAGDTIYVHEGAMIRMWMWTSGSC